MVALNAHLMPSSNLNNQYLDFVLSVEESECQLCRLGVTRNKFVIGRGNPLARIYVEGEAPGAEEDKTGLPFVGASGKRLDRMLTAAGFDVEKDVYISNPVMCRPPDNRKPFPDELAACKSSHDKLLSIIQPDCILCFGRVPAEYHGLIKPGQSMASVLGKWQRIPRNGASIPGMVLYHPSYLGRPQVIVFLEKEIEILRSVKKTFKI